MTQMIHNCLEQLVSHKSVHFMIYQQVCFWFVIGIQNRSVSFCSNRALSKLDHLQTKKISCRKWILIFTSLLPSPSAPRTSFYRILSETAGRKTDASGTRCQSCYILLCRNSLKKQERVVFKVDWDGERSWFLNGQVAWQNKLESFEDKCQSWYFLLHCDRVTKWERVAFKVDWHNERS